MCRYGRNWESNTQCSEEWKWEWSENEIGGKFYYAEVLTLISFYSK